MDTIEVTNVSSKGQVVIPRKIRQKMGIRNGTKLMVITDGANLLLKPVKAPKLASFNRLIKSSQKLARKSGLKKSDITKAIKKVRNAGRS